MFPSLVDKSATEILSSSKRTPTLSRNRNSLDLNKNTLFLKVSILPPMDLFSLLPDHLISSILSHLPFHQAARTSTLSRRWRTLWTGITAVNITADHLSPGNTNKQIQYVDTILSRPELNLASKFHIKFCPTDEHHCPVMARWAEELGRRGVSELSLINVGAVYATVPCILSCKSLTVLKLRACKLDNGDGCSTSPPPLVGCTNLRSLDLEGVAVSDATIREVASSCEHLESLNVQYSSQHKVIVHHQRLARFILRSRVCSCVDISAPNLEEWELDVPSDLKRISVLAPVVRRSSICFQWCSSQRGSHSLAEQLGGLLAGIASTKYLRLRGAVVKVGQLASRALLKFWSLFKC